VTLLFSSWLPGLLIIPERPVAATKTEMNEEARKLGISFPINLLDS
jgi:hypothetical protein